MKLIAASALLSILGSILGVTAAADNFFNPHSIRQGQRSLQQGNNMNLCSDDVKECDDGSFVKRNPNKCREFLPCPEDLEGLCDKDVQDCGDGVFVGRDPYLGCDFLPCPEPEVACAMDVQECADGSSVARDPARNCAFKPCPRECPSEDGGAPYMAPCEGLDGMYCFGETYTRMDGCNTCKCGGADGLFGEYALEGLAACTVKACPKLPAKEDTTDEAKGNEAGTASIGSPTTAPIMGDDPTSDATSASVVGLSAIVAVGSFLGAAMS